MKKIILPILASALVIGACSNKAEDENKEAVKDLRTYVDSVSRLDKFEGDRWTTVESGYQEKEAVVQEKSVAFNEQLQKDYDRVKADYEALKEKVQADQAKNANAYKVIIRNALFGESVIGDDMSFSFMTPANAANTYQRFVDGVSANKDNYSREDWDEVKVLYEAMDTRKNEIEREMPKGDNMKIAGLKVRFASIKAVNRPGTKADENAAAKENRE